MIGFSGVGVLVTQCSEFEGVLESTRVFDTICNTAKESQKMR